MKLSTYYSLIAATVCRLAYPVPLHAWSHYETYELLTKGWQVFGDIAYQATLVRDSEGGLIGVTFTLKNMSKKKAIRLSRKKIYPVPFAVEIADAQSNILNPEDPSNEKQVPRTYWVLPAGGVERHFISVLTLLPHSVLPQLPRFAGSETERYRVSVDLAAWQEDSRLRGRLKSKFMLVGRA